MAKRFTLITISILILFTIVGCKKDFENQQTVRQLYQQYKNGEITACKLYGETVYSAGFNAEDAGGNIYDKNGIKIGNCNFAWNQVDTICRQLTDCEVIYRVKNNIWGQPAVDKYKLSR